MDILLTHGYFLYDDPHERAVMRPYPPLGILYLSSHLKARGFSVEVWDSTFRSEAEFADYVAAARPPVVGFYANMLTRRTVLRMIPHARAAGATVIVGGPDPASYAEAYLQHGAQIVVIGEGEQTVEALLPRLAATGMDGLAAIEGIVFCDPAGTPVRTSPRPYLSDLDAQPFPDRAAIDLHAYMDVWKQHHGHSAISLITARGCAYHCAWCSHAVFGHTHRRRSVANVVAEVEQIVARYDPELLWYADDVFTIHHRWLFDYAAALRARGLRLPFETITREDRLNEKVVATLAEMGCFRIWIGAESGSQQILDAMQRRTDAARVVEMVHLLQRYGIQAGMFIMLGYEGEDMAQLEETVERLKAASPDVFLTTVAYPIKGTSYFERVADRVVATTPWAEGSDRDYAVAGRHSPRFYRHATRWMVGEVALHQQWHAPRRDWLRLAKALVNAKVGRVGMRLSHDEVEG